MNLHILCTTSIAKIYISNGSIIYAVIFKIIIFELFVLGIKILNQINSILRIFLMLLYYIFGILYMAFMTRTVLNSPINEGLNDIYISIYNCFNLPDFNDVKTIREIILYLTDFVFVRVFDVILLALITSCLIGEKSSDK